MAGRSVFDASAVKSEFEGAGINPNFIPQIWKHLLHNPNCGWDDIPSLPVAAYSLLRSKFKPSTSTLHSAVDSIDGVTTKLLIKLKHGEFVEAVIMRYDTRLGKYAGKPRPGGLRSTLCISSQVGCKMGCNFCATGSMGFKSNLSSGEIVEQLVHASRIAAIRNVVFMGMGEPLNNYSAVIEAIRVMTAPPFQLSPKKITVSTVLGILLSCYEFQQKIFIEYIMLDGVNDEEQHAHQLGKLLQAFEVVVNLIPFNPIGSLSRYKTSNDEKVTKFQIILRGTYNIRTTVRKQMGQDISGACGQLVVNIRKKRSSREMVALPFLLLYVIAAASANIITTLPGYPDTLPFHLETGYIGVGENERTQLFYYFVESEGDPNKDPLVLWLTGGPGCSGFSGLVYEIGPLRFDVSSFNGDLPRLVLNPYSWTKAANIIFLDSPVGTGFSYGKTPEGFLSSDTIATVDNYSFLKKWLSAHPRFIKNRLYLGGDSYAGKTVPLLALEIANRNDGGLEQRMNLKGYLIGNPTADANIDSNEKIPYAHRMALISDEYFELAKSSCNGKYINPDPNNVQCRNALELCNECTKNINNAYILDPKCDPFSPKHNYILEDDPNNFLVMFKQEQQWCRNNNYLDSAAWANDQTVQEALYIRNGTVREWKRCNRSLSGYERNVASVIQSHQILNQKGFQILVYSGDHDMIIPYIGTLKWIRSLNLTIKDNWRPWNVDGQVAGFALKT
ncbi:hypothetical protein F511_01595 [Dorcoceras hygrometricum]|nr:hypothetical protein F511_01595 [Dorcoceras hygrometricum]